MNRHATPIAEGWDAASNPHTYVVTAAQKKVERNANNNGNPQIIRALQGFSRTNGYPTVEFSIEIRNRQGGAVCVGVTTASAIANVNRALGADNMSWAYWANEGRILTNNANVHGGLRPAESGAVVVIRLDRNANTVTFFLRGEQGLDQLGLPVSVAGAGDAELFPAVSFINNTAEARLFYTQPLPIRYIATPRNVDGMQDDRRRAITKDLNGLPKDNSVNIVILGHCSAGKGALIQAMVTAMRNEDRLFMHRDLVVRPASGHATTAVSCIPADGEEKKADKRAFLWDTWGWLQTDPFEFERFLQPLFDGFLLPGFAFPKTEDDLPSLRHPRFKRNEALSGLTAMHAAILVVSAEQFVDGKLPDATLNRMIAICRYAKKQFYNRDPVVVLSNCDRVDPLVASDPLAIYQSTICDRYVGYLSGVLEINACNIFPVRLYFSERCRVPKIDGMALGPLSIAVRQACMQVQTELRNQPEGTR